jgi:hypothetical protein
MVREWTGEDHVERKRYIALMSDGNVLSRLIVRHADGSKMDFGWKSAGGRRIQDPLGYEATFSRTLFEQGYLLVSR